MKRCPQCHRVEIDDALVFCRVDGTSLVSDSLVNDSEAGTVRLNTPSDPADVATGTLSPTTNTASNRSTGPTTVLPTQLSANATGQLTKRTLQRNLVIVLIALVVVGVGVSLYFYFSRRASHPIESIAVMPFVNASGNADFEYLSDGMTETLITSLSQLQNLNVKPRSSVFRYKGKEINPQTIGNELSVQAILNGRVTQRGQDLSLFVELTDVALDKVVWSQQYNRKQNDLVTLQTDIARDVSSRLTSKLSGADEAKVTKTYTTNPEAYQLYLQGKYYHSKYNEDSYQKAIDLYQQAINIDPNYALAYLGIAEVYNNASDWYLAPTVAMPKAKAAVLKAIELDNTLAQAHHELGILIFWYDWDWAAAETEMKRAVELDPNYTMYGLYLAAMGKHEEAIRAQEMTNRRSPLDLQFGMDLSGIYLAAGQVDQAIEQSRKTIELDPNYWGGYQELGLALLRNKHFPEAIAALEKSRSLDNNPSVSGYLGFAYATAGNKAEAQRVLNELKELSKKQYVPAYSIAIIYGGLNDKDQAFEWLNKAYGDRSFYIALLNFESTLGNLRPDPRFNDLVKRLGL
jgi:TolB-like protein/Flp pilus assembly protein TadD